MNYNQSNIGNAVPAPKTAPEIIQRLEQLEAGIACLGTQVDNLIKHCDPICSPAVETDPDKTCSPSNCAIGARINTSIDNLYRIRLAIEALNDRICL